MSKNRRKPLKKEPVISKTDFSFYESKIYIIATIIMFHIVPLVFVMMGENGQLLLLQFFLMMLNPMFIALSGLIYGIKQGLTLNSHCLWLLSQWYQYRCTISLTRRQI